MKTIVYTSEIAQGVDDENQLLADIVGRASKQNSKTQITGTLVMQNRRFLQVLEGPDPTIDELFQRISSDQRHCNVRVLLESSVTHRTFPNWSMKPFSLPDPTTFCEEALSFVCDAMTKNFRFEGHMFIKSLQRLLSEPRLSQWTITAKARTEVGSAH